jgi:hypothetical protein
MEMPPLNGALPLSRFGIQRYVTPNGASEARGRKANDFARPKLMPLSKPIYYLKAENFLFSVRKYRLLYTGALIPI